MRVRRLMAAAVASTLATALLYALGSATILAIAMGKHKAPIPPPGMQACIYSMSNNTCMNQNCTGGMCQNTGSDVQGCPCHNAIRIVQAQTRFVTTDLLALDSFPASATFVPAGDWSIEGFFDGFSF